MSRLRKQTPLTFKRPTGDYFDETTRKSVRGAPVDVETIGNLQPYRNGTGQVVLPDGITQNDAIVYYTTTKLSSADQFTNTSADYTEIDGLEYQVFFAENWTRTNLSLAHYKVILIRRDKLPEGT